MISSSRFRVQRLHDTRDGLRNEGDGDCSLPSETDTDGGAATLPVVEAGADKVKQIVVPLPGAFVRRRRVEILVGPRRVLILVGLALLDF